MTKPIKIKKSKLQIKAKPKYLLFSVIHNFGNSGKKIFSGIEKNIQVTQKIFCVVVLVIQVGLFTFIFIAFLT